MAGLSSDEKVRLFIQENPSCHVFKIEKFSLLPKHHIEKCESSVFDINGYKWKLILYPSGNIEEGGRDHVSLYLAREDTSSLPSKAVDVQVRLFVLGQMERVWITEEGSSRFSASKTKWGAPKLISLANMYETSYGYLVNDCCIFGVDIDGGQPAGKLSESFSLIEKPMNNKVTWKMMEFSTFNQLEHKSQEFVVGHRKWNILLYPEGCGDGKNNSLSVFLEAVGYTDSTVKAKTYAKFKLRVLDQIHQKHIEYPTSYWFDVDRCSYGFPKFMPLQELRDASRGFLVNDLLYVGVEIDVVSVTK